MAETEPRTRVEKLLMELLFQTIMTEDSSNGYVRDRLCKAGFTPEEISETMDDEIAGE